MRAKIINLGALTANAKAFNQNLPTLKRPGLGLVEWSNPKLPAIDWNSSLLSAQLFLRRLLPSSAHVRFTKPTHCTKASNVIQSKRYCLTVHFSTEIPGTDSRSESVVMMVQLPTVCDTAAIIMSIDCIGRPMRLRCEAICP